MSEALRRAAVEDRLRRAAEAMRQDVDRRWRPVARMLTNEADYAERECVPVAEAVISVVDAYLSDITRRTPHGVIRMDGLTSETLAAWREDAKKGSDYAEEPESSRILALIDALESARRTLLVAADDIDGNAGRIADRLRARGSHG